MEETLTGIWRSFVGQLQHQGDGKDPNFVFSKITQEFSFSNHTMVIFIDILLLLMLFLYVICKQSKVDLTPSRFRAHSAVQFLSAIFNGGLAAGYLGLGFWILADKYVKSHNIQPLDQWLVAMIQGLTWLVATLVVCLITPRGSRVFLRLWSIVICLFAAFLCGDALLVIFRRRGLSIRVILDLLSFPGAILLAVCASHFRCIHGCQNINEDLRAPLNGEDGGSENDTKDDVTCFARAGILSSLSFWWLNPLMKKGAEKELEEVDIPQLRYADRAENCSMLFLENFNKQRKDDKSYSSLWWTLALCQRRQLIISGLFALLKVLTLSAGPLLLNDFIKVSEGKASFKYEGFILAAGLFFAKCLESISQRQWYFRTRLIGLQVRSLLCAEIYRKQLTISNVAKLTHSAGEIMNYVTVDAYRIGEFPFWFHQSWTTILQLCIVLIILYQAVGLATIAALVVIILTVLCNTPLAKLQHKFQTKLMEAQDERLKATQEALVNMKILRLYAWETHFKSVIENLRKDEFKWLSAVQLRRAYNSFLFWSSPILVSAATFGSCYLLHIPLNVSNVFTFVATLKLVQDPIRTIPDVIGVVIQAKVAMARIQKFLEAPELQSKPINRSYNGMTEYAVAVKSCNFSWEDNLLKPTLRDIHVEVKPGKKVAICGEVGSGKSTLLAAILGEIPNVGGLFRVRGKIAYVSQTAWIQTGTIQENILFGLPMDKQRYKEAIEKCSLAKDLELLPFGDLTEIGERGVNLSGGQKQRIQLARAVYQDADIYLLDDPFSAVDAHTATSLFNECIMGALSGKTVLLVTHQVDFLPAFDFVLFMSDGEIKHAASYSVMLASSIEFRDLVDAHKSTAGSDKLAEVVSSKFPRPSTREIKNVSSANHSNSVNVAADVQLIKKEEKEMGDTGFKPYIQYLNQNKGYVYFTVVALSQVTFVAGLISQNSWMAANVQNPSVSTLRLIAVYLAIGFSSTFFLLLRSLFGVILGLQSSKSLFSQLLNSLFRAPMSFFDSTPLGRILSRVSSDLSIIDLDLPFSLVFAFGATTNAYSNLGVLAVVTWQVLFVSIPMVYLCIRLQRYYFCSAKELMRINGTTKSLVANHLAESISGAMTIRAFKEQDRFLEKNNGFIDRNASPLFHNFAANEWLIQRLETMSAAVLASSALAMSLLPPGTFSSGFTGMALSYGLSLNISLVFSIQNQCTLANHIISVERLKQYMHIPSEAAEIIEDNRPSPLWPSNGKVELHDLKIRYRPNTQLVLRGISCTFEGGHKIGIVGRTGSGKTTLISALFRLVEPAGGKIIIDGMDISKIGLHDLRSRLGIIPQDPTLFHGTVRYNLDPLSQHTDAMIWEVLGKCQLRQAVEEKEMGLDSLVIEDGSNWSMGQRQLFCLGRALLKRSRILVLDEATASVDNATDTILQKTIRSEFADSTVITVAHRIPTVMNCTMVLSISDGKLVEYDEPMKLMKKQGSMFGELVREYWSNANTSG